MRSVNFKKIQIRNFLSYGDDPIEIGFQPGLTFITGTNKDKDSKNGVGKTALIVESLSFLLFGKTYRDIVNKSIVNNITNKTCIVEGWLSVDKDEYHIVRSLFPSKLFLYKNDEDISRTITETNKDIIEVLGISKEIFTNTIVMTNLKSEGFFGQDTASKTKFIEGILGLECFARMYEVAKTEYLDAKKALSLHEVRLQEVQRSLENDKLYEKNENEKNDKLLESLLNQINEKKAIQPVDNTSLIKEIEQDVIIINELVSEKTAKLNNIRIKRETISSALKTSQNNLNKLNSTKFDCPTCKRPLELHNKDEIEKEKEATKIEIKEAEEQLQKIDTVISTANKWLSDKKETIRQQNDKKISLEKEQVLFVNSEKELNDLKGKLNNAQSFINPFSSKILSIEENILALKSEYVKLEQNLKIADIVKLACSPTGIKTILIKKIIKTFNDRFNFYLTRLNAPCVCQFDEFFTEKFTNAAGTEFTYSNLSGGEAKRVDFALLFAFRDIRRLQSGVGINITVMDEILDSAMDASGMASVLALLKEKTENSDESYFIITHRSENIEVEGCSIINLEKENGITRIV